ncbi:MAG: hypothetical protein J6S48_00370, partial [Bacteroidales bacterium]|nr:hypothetical protein [Bacteroidales bacterium]
MGGYTQSNIFYLQEYFNLHTPTGDKKGMEMANKIWDGYVELFNWYENVDEHTLELHGDDIRYDLMFMNFLLNNVRFPGEGLAPRYKELKFNKVADFYAGAVNSSIAKKLRQPDFDQQALANDFQELHEVMTIARLSGNSAMAEKIQKMADTQFDAMEASAPGMGAAYRNFFYGINTPASAAETADTTDTESPEGEK